ncbi:MAG: hypothetical protein ABSG36_03485 [Acidimicrobiales bacterium]|jgi:hypothetical protein
MGDKEIPVETFDALLRDLVTWNLVVAVERDGTQAWELAARAQQRLAELTRGRGPWPAERTAYLGRRCAECNRREVTWMRYGEYICEQCWQTRLSRTEDGQLADAAPSRRSRWRLRHRAEIA